MDPETARARRGSADLLLRLADRRLERAAADLGALRARMAALDHDIARLRAGRAHDSTAFVVETGRFAGAFLRGLRAEEERLEAARDDLARKVELAERHVRDLFAETKKAGAIRDHVAATITADDRRREDAEHAEIALSVWRRTRAPGR